MGLRRARRRFLRRIGVLPGSVTYAPRFQRAMLLRAARINLVLDVGANTGQYATELRGLGYRQRIASFEPLREAFEQLRTIAAGDRKWRVYPFALGEALAKANINIAGNSFSSSLLRMLPRHAEAAPGSAYVEIQPVTVRALDEVAAEIIESGDRVWLKLDTQGYESQVIAGANATLQYVRMIQVEMSLVELYEGATTMKDLCALLHARDYRLVALEPVFSDPVSGEILQMDGIFQRRPSG